MTTICTQILESFYGTSGDCYESRHAAVTKYCQLGFGRWAIGGGVSARITNNRYWSVGSVL